MVKVMGHGSGLLLIGSTIYCANVDENYSGLSQIHSSTPDGFVSMFRRIFVLYIYI